jgi:aspartate aminotransferase-like enzyme
MSEEIRYFLPGPTYVLRKVREAMTQEPIGHRGPEYKALHRSVTERLPPLFGTSREVLIATGSGSLSWDMAVATATRADTPILNLTNGAFSERFHTTCKAWGRPADQLSVPWGQPIDPELVAQALDRKRYEVVTVAHSETSTGVFSPLEEIARVVHGKSDALLLVDAVSSLAGAPVKADEWGLDLVFTSSQKALAVPPGLALITVSDRFRERAEKVADRGYYTDLLRSHKKHLGGATVTTPAIPQIWALDRELEVIAEEGLEARFERHRQLRRRTEEWVAGNGFAYASAPEGASPTVSCLKPPEGIEAPAVVQALKEEGFTVGGGYGVWKPTTFRIGHMGEVRMDDLERLLAKIDEIVDRL